MHVDNLNEQELSDAIKSMVENLGPLTVVDRNGIESQIKNEQIDKLNLSYYNSEPEIRKSTRLMFIIPQDTFYQIQELLGSTQEWFSRRNEKVAPVEECGDEIKNRPEIPN